MDRLIVSGKDYRVLQLYNTNHYCSDAAVSTEINGLSIKKKGSSTFPFLCFYLSFLLYSFPPLCFAICHFLPSLKTQLLSVPAAAKEQLVDTPEVLSTSDSRSPLPVFITISSISLCDSPTEASNT